MSVSDLMPKHLGIRAMLILSGVFISLAILKVDYFLLKVYGFGVPDLLLVAATLLMMVAGVAYIWLAISVLISMFKARKTEQGS